MQLTFLGATKTVTGSKYLLECEGKRLLVDCGLFQGYKELRLRNWNPLPIDPSTLDAVILTHAHIDHSGYLPLLVKKGFQGPIYATEATCDLCKILLPDSGYLHEEEARRANKYGYSKHKPALPLYTEKDAKTALKQFKPVTFDDPHTLFDQVTVSWHRNGHILGSALVQFDVAGTRVLFTGDMGRPNDPVMKPPTIIRSTDYLITESTYGDRLHANSDPADYIETVINKTIARGGTILIPAFAVGRTQSILYHLLQLREANKIPYLPIYLDSPMAINATKLMRKHSNEHKLDREQCLLTCNLATYIHTPDESRHIDQQPMPKIIISASGMMTGGRILHHLRAYASDARNTILLTGFQAGGTRGARLLAGEKTLKIFGRVLPINAEVASLSNTSAHADYQEMLAWLSHFDHAPRKVFITHGEEKAANSFKSHITERFGWSCKIPAYLDREILS